MYDTSASNDYDSIWPLKFGFSSVICPFPILKDNIALKIILLISLAAPWSSTGNRKENSPCGASRSVLEMSAVTIILLMHERPTKPTNVDILLCPVDRTLLPDKV